MFLLIESGFHDFLNICGLFYGFKILIDIDTCWKGPWSTAQTNDISGNPFLISSLSLLPRRKIDNYRCLQLTFYYEQIVIMLGASGS